MAGIKVDFGAKDVGFTSTISKANSSIDGMERNVKSAGSSMKSSFLGMAKAGAALAVGFGAIKLAITGIKSSISGIKDAIENASNLNETIAKTGEIFEEGAGEIESWADTAATSLGQSKQQAMDAASQFAIFGKAAGLSGDQLVGFSKELVELSADLASFNNASPEETILAIGSALRGEAEPMRRFGVLLDDASLRAEAFKMGIISTTKNALTPQQKVLAAHALIMNQTGLAQGDFMRTSDGLANQQRILAAQITNVSTRIGQALLPAAQEMVSFINAKILPAVNSMMDAFSGKTTLAEGIKPLLNVLTEIKAKVMATAIATSEFLVSTFGPGSSLFSIVKASFGILGDYLGIALAKGLKVAAEALSSFGKKIRQLGQDYPLIFGLTGSMVPDFGKGMTETLETNMKLMEKNVGNSINMIKNIISDGDITRDFSEAGAAFFVTFDRENNRLNPGGKIDEMAGKMRKLEMASKDAADAAARINIEDDLSLKIGGQRVSNADRIKELSLDIVEAKALGNVEQAAELEASKAYYEQLERSLNKNKTLQDSITDATKARQSVIDGVLDKQKQVTRELQEQLALSGQLAAKIQEAERKDKIDRGGRLEKRANDAIARGDFRQAVRASNRIATNEDNAAIQEAFGGDGKFAKNISDIAKEQGIDTFRKSSRELRKELAELAKKRQKEMPPGAAGKDKEAVKGKPLPPKDPILALSDLVKDIKNLVAKIEPKLPQHALI